MYLAQKKIKGRREYFIRESYQDGKWWKSRELFALGQDPSEYIIYPGARSFYIHEDVESRLKSEGVDPTTDEIEDIFWPFLKYEVRHAHEHFRNRGKCWRKKHLSYDEEHRLDEQIHEFDRRRFLYLKSGNLNLSRVREMPMRYFIKLSDKSRDEVEQHFLRQESMLNERELKRYVYASFNLQEFFARPEARSYPEMLDQKMLDEIFIDVLCYINRDDRFWRQKAPEKFLHPYLSRYVIMFFDYGFGADTFMEDYVNRFIGSRRQYRPPHFSPRVTEQETSELFGKTKKELLQMETKVLARLYKKMAIKYHPDQGGDHEKFIQLTQAYRAIIQTRKRSM